MRPPPTIRDSTKKIADSPQVMFLTPWIWESTTPPSMRKSIHSVITACRA